MKFRSFLLFVVLTLVLAPVVAWAADGVFPFPWEVRDYPNGLRAIVVKTPYPEIVSLQIPVLTGSRNEVEPGKSGFAHFFEHMMFRGTEKYPPEVYGEILKEAGADQNAFTTDDFTNYHITFTKDDLEKVLELEADRFQNLSYSLDQFKTEARAVLGEYNKNSSNPIRKMFEVQRDRLFREHTYKHTTMGFLEDIEDMPNEYEYSLEFYDRFYRPENTVVIVVGDVDPERTFRWIEKYWGSWKRGGYRVEIPVEPPQEGPIAVHIEWPSATLPWVGVGFRGPAFSDSRPDMAGLDLLSNLLFSPSSDLYQRLVVTEQKVDQIFPYFPDRQDPYLVSVFARVIDPADVAYVRDTMLAEFARARREAFEPGKVEETKDHMKYSFIHAMDNSEAIAGTLASYVRFDRDPETIDRLYAVYDSLTSEGLLEIARKTFRDSSAHQVTLSTEPLPGITDEIPSLSRFDPQVKDERAEGALSEVILDNDSPLVNFRFLFNAGSALDPPGKEGLASLTAAIVSDAGSRAHTYSEITNLLYPMAGEFSSQVDKEMTVFSGMAHRDNLDAYADIILGQLLSPGWRDSDFQRLRTQMINAIRVNLVGNNDEELAKEVLYNEIYDGHPYGHLNLGTIRSLESMTVEDCKGFYERYYNRSNLVLGLAGDLDDRFLAKVRRELDRLPVGEPTRLRLAAPSPVKGRTATIVEKETRATAISWGFPIPINRSHGDFAALWLVRSFLGEHRSSNSYLYQRIREIRGLNYGDYAYVEYFPNGMFQFHPDPNLGRSQQIFQVWIRPVMPENTLFALRISLWEFEKLLENGLTAEQFEATRNYLSKFVYILTKTQDRQLGYRLDSRFYGIGDFASTMQKKLASLTLDEVNRVLREYLQPDDIQFVFVTKDGQELRDRLIEDGPSTVQYDGEKTPELLAEDEQIHRFKIGLRPEEIRIVKADEVFLGPPESGR